MVNGYCFWNSCSPEMAFVKLFANSDKYCSQKFARFKYNLEGIVCQKKTLNYLPLVANVIFATDSPLVANFWQHFVAHHLVSSKFAANLWKFAATTFCGYPWTIPLDWSVLKVQCCHYLNINSFLVNIFD